MLVRGQRIESAGPSASIVAPAGAETMKLPGATLMPGLIEAHSSVLHATTKPRGTIECSRSRSRSGSYGRRITSRPRSSPVGRRFAIWERRVRARQPGPQAGRRARPHPRSAQIVTTRAIVATGTYAPKGFAPDWSIRGRRGGGRPGSDSRRARSAGRGADWIKVYGDYRAGPNGEATPTFSLDEMTLIVQTASSIGRPVVVHASTPEGMRRAVWPAPARSSTATAEPPTSSN